MVNEYTISLVLRSLSWSFSSARAPIVIVALVTVLDLVTLSTVIIFYYLFVIFRLYLIFNRISRLFNLSPAPWEHLWLAIPLGRTRIHMCLFVGPSAGLANRRGLGGRSFLFNLTANFLFNNTSFGPSII